MKKESKKLIAQNKKAYHEYFIEETFQAGIELVGTEVKSLRAGECNLKDSYVKIESGEAYVYGMHVSPYEYGNIFNRDPVRKRRLLLHKKEIRAIAAGITRDGYTALPLKIYFDRCYVKIDVALAKGKKLHDKRDTIAKKDQLREAQRDLKMRVKI